MGILIQNSQQRLIACCPIILYVNRNVYVSGSRKYVATHEWQYDDTLDQRGQHTFSRSAENASYEPACKL